MKTNKLFYQAEKQVEEYGEQFKMIVQCSLDDDCHNRHADFSITYSMYDNKGEYVSGGCDLELISEHFPELSKFTPLHLCSWDGVPLYPIENGAYMIKHEGPVKAANYLRIKMQELFALDTALTHENGKVYFKYLLFHLGIVDRWKAEAAEFIKFLEEKTGMEWENPYSPEEERFRLTLTEEDIRYIEENGLA